MAREKSFVLYFFPLTSDTYTQTHREREEERDESKIEMEIGNEKGDLLRSKRISLYLMF